MTQHIAGHDIFLGKPMRSTCSPLLCDRRERRTHLLPDQQLPRRKREASYPEPNAEGPGEESQGLQKSRASGRRVKSKAQITDLERGGWPEAVE